jgi:hypothetical protein
MPQTTDQILKSIRRRAMLPDSDSTFSKEDLLDMISEEVKYFAVPHLLQAKEEFLIDYVDYDVNNTGIYDIPYRAIGQRLKDVQLINTGDSVTETTRINVDDLPDYKSTYSSDISSNVFYLLDNKIVFPTMVTGNYTTVRVYYYLSPNKLVSENEVGIISSIDTNTGTLTLEEFPEAFSSLGEMDFVAHRNPNKILDYDITPASVNQNTKTVVFDPEDLPDSLVVGDYLSLAEETIVLQLPEEFQHIIAQRVVVQILEALGDEQNKQSAERRLKQMETSLSELVMNRVDGAIEKIKPRKSLLKQTQSSKYFRKGNI